MHHPLVDLDRQKWADRVAIISMLDYPNISIQCATKSKRVVNPLTGKLLNSNVSLNDIEEKEKLDQNSIIFKYAQENGLVKFPDYDSIYTNKKDLYLIQENLGITVAYIPKNKAILLKDHNWDKYTHSIYMSNHFILLEENVIVLNQRFGKYK